MGLLQEWYVQETKDSEEEKTHRPLNDEQLFFHAVSSGDIDFVRQNCRQQKFTETEGVGILSRDSVTNLKYHFVITTAFVTRLCVESGMELEQAFRLSDFYILKLDHLHTLQSVIDLHDRMVLDFTGKMRLLVKNPGTSKPVTLCIDYIYVAGTGLFESHVFHYPFTPPRVTPAMIYLERNRYTKIIGTIATKIIMYILPMSKFI